MDENRSLIEENRTRMAAALIACKLVVEMGELGRLDQVRADKLASAVRHARVAIGRSKRCCACTAYIREPRHPRGARELCDSCAGAAVAAVAP